MSDTTRTDAMWWAVERWNAEVKNRPRTNVYRPILDSTWRQVIRYFGGDPDELLGCEVQICVEQRAKEVVPDERTT